MESQEFLFWNLPQKILQSKIEALPEGLSNDQAKERLARFGPNTLHVHQQRALILQFLSRFRNPLVIILLVASAISAFTGDVSSFLIISAIVLMSVTLDFVQEYQAGQAAERLRQSVSIRVHVLREGSSKNLLIADLVQGDIVLLSAGDLVPADARILESKDFFVNQSLLTGEAYPIEKYAIDLLNFTNDINMANNAVFMGTSVISGTARILICRTGSDTALGEIAESLTQKAPPTTFEIGTRKFGMLIMRLTVLLVLFVLLVNALFHRPMLESFLFAIALAVGLTPELLPMVVSVTLARGAMAMAKKQVIMKHLPAIQNLGGMDILCTDKTGTLTEARIHLERHLDFLGQDSSKVLELAYINSYFESGLKSPLDDAILEHADIDVSKWNKLDEVPFDFERRCVSVLVDNGSERLIVVKGAPEHILQLSTHYMDSITKSENPLNEEVSKSIHALYDQLGNDGFRVLGIAWRRVDSDHPHAVVTDEAELIFAGFAAFLDPPKASAADALSKLSSSGITLKIVTGDNELVTCHLCEQLGFPIQGILTGDMIRELDEPALQARAEITNIFCRVTPTQKNRIILALKARGHTVGYMGDGINDASSLHSADIGISVESAVDVAKEAADMILLKQDLHVLYDGVLEGRRTFGNIMKYIMMGTSSNFGNMFSMAGASLFLPFLPMLPMQILLNNMRYDISEIPIPTDRVDEEYLRMPQTWDMKFIRNFMWTIGPIISLFDVLMFYILIEVFKADAILFHTGWFIESMATQVLVIFVIRTRRNPFKSRPGRLLIVTSLSIVMIAIVLPFTPLAGYLGFEALPPLFYAVLTGIVIVYLLAVEVVKRWFYRYHRY